MSIHQLTLNDRIKILEAQVDALTRRLNLTLNALDELAIYSLPEDTVAQKIVNNAIAKADAVEERTDEQS